MSQLNKSRIKALVATAYADGVFDVKELEYINKKAESLNVSKNDLLDIIQSPYENNPIHILSEEEKFAFMYDLMELMNADNHIDDSEIRIFKTYLSKLGFKESVKDEIYSLIKSSVKENISFIDFYKSI